VNPASQEYFAGVRALCDDRNLLFMVDEVQTGLGRTGHWFAFQGLGVMPDVVTVAKALGNGMPIGACWARAEVADAFKPGDHATTYGGQPLATAAARATLAVMEAEDVPARAAATGERLRREVAGLPGVASVRGAGLLLGVELVGKRAPSAAAAALAAGLIVNPITASALRLAPSLLISPAEVDEGVAILASVLADMEGDEGE
jgi:acetylornithine/N-succinyldiaminopimelate aminotransferase